MVVTTPALTSKRLRSAGDSELGAHPQMQVKGNRIHAQLAPHNLPPAKDPSPDTHGEVKRACSGASDGKLIYFI